MHKQAEVVMVNSNLRVAANIILASKRLALRSLGRVQGQSGAQAELRDECALIVLTLHTFIAINFAAN
jgi:hypothetical protein